MKLTVIGSGDAFGSGGRLQTCYHVADAENEFLIDCGATALIGFHKAGLDPNRVGTIFISHLHGDHFAGLVWWLLHALHVARRTAPLDIVGPQGIAERYRTAAEALFPGATFSGPAIIEERESTLIVGEDARVAVDDYGFLWIDLVNQTEK